MVITSSNYGQVYKSWFDSLQPELKTLVHHLHRKDLRWNWVLLLFVVMWLGAGILIMSYESILIRLFGYFIIGICIHGMANLMHEGIHNNLFHRQSFNWLYGFIGGMPALFSITAYKVNHLVHHQYTGTEKDPDEMFNLTSNKTLLRLFFYLWLFFGIFTYVFHVPIMALKFANRNERRTIILEYLLMFTIYASVILFSIWVGKFEVVVQCWFIPMFFAGILANVRGWAEHTMTDKNGLLLNTRTVTSSPIYSFLNINLNYHLEHHLFPKIPWYNLPKLHKLLLPLYKEQNVKVYNSYFTFLRDAFRAGPLNRI